ncbi:MAG: hypothetical protein JWN04_2359 [Myxococcaceae bacterium]|nr:hypothetical protein [Myxococcaceae bacterium]
MRLLRPVLVLCVASCAACSRPTLDDVEGDSDGSVATEDTGARAAPADAQVDPPAPAVDAGAVAVDSALPPARDAGVPVVTLPAADAGCNAADGGCDTLPPVLADCSGGTMSSSSIGTARVTALTINGQSGTLAHVKAGAQVDISVQVMLGSCGNFGVPAMYLGVDGSNDQCQHGGICTAVTLPSLFAFTVSAPQTPGLHPVLAGLSGSFSTCTGTSDVQPNTQIAALCVQ